DVFHRQVREIGRQIHFHSGVERSIRCQIDALAGEGETLQPKRIQDGGLQRPCRLDSAVRNERVLLMLNLALARIYGRREQIGRLDADSALSGRVVLLAVQSKVQDLTVG